MAGGADVISLLIVSMVAVCTIAFLGLQKLHLTGEKKVIQNTSFSGLIDLFYQS